MVHQAAFVLPVISLVIITILNDGTMITISHDKVRGREGGLRMGGKEDGTMITISHNKVREGLVEESCGPHEWSRGRL